MLLIQGNLADGIAMQFTCRSRCWLTLRQVQKKMHVQAIIVKAFSRHCWKKMQLNLMCIMCSSRKYPYLPNRRDFSKTPTVLEIPLFLYSGAPVAQRTAKGNTIVIDLQNHVYCMHRNRNPCNSFLWSTWLATWITGVCTQQRRRHHATWQPSS